MIDQIFLIGIMGDFFIVLAWAVNAAEAVKRHKSLMDLKFAGITATGVIILAYYSWLRVDWVFLSLQFILLFLILIEIIYSLHVKKLHKVKWGKGYGIRSRGL